MQQRVACVLGEPEGAGLLLVRHPRRTRPQVRGPQLAADGAARGTGDRVECGLFRCRGGAQAAKRKHRAFRAHSPRGGSAHSARAPAGPSCVCVHGQLLTSSSHTVVDDRLRALPRRHLRGPPRSAHEREDQPERAAREEGRGRRERHLALPRIAGVSPVFHSVRSHAHPCIFGASCYIHRARAGRWAPRAMIGTGYVRARVRVCVGAPRAPVSWQWRGAVARWRGVLGAGGTAAAPPRRARPLLVVCDSSSAPRFPRGRRRAGPAGLGPALRCVSPHGLTHRRARDFLCFLVTACFHAFAE